MIYRFGEFALDPDEFRMSRNGSLVALDPRNLQVLHYLLENRGRLVRKQEILDCVWSETTVTENALTRVIAGLRKALEDDSRIPVFIETVPTLGYRFIAKVSMEETAPIDTPIADTPIAKTPSPTKTFPAVSRRNFLWAAGACASVGGVAWVASRGRRMLPPAMSVVVPFVDGATVADARPRLLGAPVIAPDGSAIVVSLSTADGVYLFRRPLNSNHMTRMEGTQFASQPFWSSDSKQIGFFADGQLKRMPAFGGSSVILCEVVEPRGGSWHGDVILFAPNLRGIFQIVSTGGTPLAVTTVDAGAGENSHRFPLFLPDGKRFLYFSRSDSLDKRGIYLESLDRKETRRRVLVADGQFALGMAPDSGKHFLITQQASRLVAQGFDCDRGSAFGEEHILLDHAGEVSVSETGALALRTQTRARSTLMWRDREGRALGTLDKPDDYWQATISPDSRSVAVVLHNGQTGIFQAWIGTTPDGPMDVLSESDHVDSIAWSQDSSTLYYVDFVQRKLLRRRINPRGPEELVQNLAAGDAIRGLSADGLTMVAERSKDNIHATVAWSSVSSTDWHLVDSNSLMGNTSLSPDGRSLAFGSSRSGRMEVYRADFPELRNLQRISTNGGSCPRWRKDGKELFYIADDDSLMAVDLSGGGGNARPRPLFHAVPAKTTEPHPSFDVVGDGTRFLLVERDRSVSETDVELVLNWPSLLSQHDRCQLATPSPALPRSSRSSSKTSPSLRAA